MRRNLWAVRLAVGSGQPTGEGRLLVFSFFEWAWGASMAVVGLAFLRGIGRRSHPRIRVLQPHIAYFSTLHWASY